LNPAPQFTAPAGSCDVHISKFSNPPTPLDDPAVQCLFDLMDNGRTYVKLSAAGETSNDTSPYMTDSGLIAMKLVSRYPERLFWASNCPRLGNPGRLYFGDAS